jgi:hypothetical protein
MVEIVLEFFKTYRSTQRARRTLRTLRNAEKRFSSANLGVPCDLCD